MIAVQPRKTYRAVSVGPDQRGVLNVVSATKRSMVCADGRRAKNEFVYGSAICTPTLAARGKPVVSVGVRPTS